MVKYIFESICVQVDKFRDTNSTLRIGKHVPIPLSLSSNLIKQPIILWNSVLVAFVETFVDALEGLATQGKAEMKIKFFEFESCLKSRLNRNSSAPNWRRCRKKPVLYFEEGCIREEQEGEK